MDESPWLGGSQTRVCDAGAQSTFFSLFRCGSQRHSAKRTSRPRISDLSGSDPETQRQQLQAAGVALSDIYQDVGISGTSGTNSRRGWHSLDSRLAQGDTWVVVSIDRIGRRWLGTMGNIHDLQRRGVRIRSLADNEQSWPSAWMPTPTRRSRSWLYSGRLRRLGVRLGTGVHSPPYHGGFGEGEGGRQEAGRSSPVVRGAGGRSRRDGGQRSQPAARR